MIKILIFLTQLFSLAAAYAIEPCVDVFRERNDFLSGVLKSKVRTALVEKYFYSERYPEKVVQVYPGIDFNEFQKMENSGYVTNQIGHSRLTDRINIELLMANFALTRLQAVEVQAILRNYARSPNDRQLIAAIKFVREGQSLSQINQKKIKDAPFVVVFDVDGTLLDQDSSKLWFDGIHEKSFLVDGEKINHVALNVGAIRLITLTKKLGGSVVIFSRNNDILIREILSAFKIDGISISSYVDGVLTSSHMTIPPEYRHLVGKYPISRLVKKDLSIIENDRVMIIDDNPEYVLQQGQLRLVPEFSIEGSIKNSDEQENFSFAAQVPKKWREKPTPNEIDRVNEHIRRIELEYLGIGRELRYLTSHLAEFKQIQVVFSPLGHQAISLLTNKDPEFTLEGNKQMSSQEALNYLLSQPDRVAQILNQKKRRNRAKYNR